MKLGAPGFKSDCGVRIRARKRTLRANHHYVREQMTTSERPAPVGQYHLRQDFQCPTSSIRVIQMASPAEAVGGHVHHRSMQIYVALEGAIKVDIDGLETQLAPYQALPVWPGSRHTAWPVDGPAVLMNISIPPLAADDQHPTAVGGERPDLRLPSDDMDVDD